jgi:hypothetical protein
MLKKICLLSLLFALGCNKHQPVQPIQQPVVPKQELPVVQENIIPSGWDEIKKDNWSFFLPKGFVEANDIEHADAAFSYQDNVIVVFLAKDPTKDNLETYVAGLSSFLEQQGVSILSIRKGKIGDRDALLLALVLEDVFSFHFVLLDNGIAYNLNCSVKKMFIKQYGKWCINIADNFRINKKDL